MSKIEPNEKRPKPGRPQRVYERAWELWRKLVEDGRLEKFVASTEWADLVTREAGVTSRSGVHEYTSALKKEGLIDPVHGGFFVCIGHWPGRGAGTINQQGLFVQTPAGKTLHLLTPEKLPDFTNWDAWKEKWRPKTTEELLAKYDAEREARSRRERNVEGLNGAWYFYGSLFTPETVVSRHDWRIKLAVAEFSSVISDERAQDEGADSAEARFKELTDLAVEMGLIVEEPEGRIRFLRPPRRTKDARDYRPSKKRAWKNSDVGKPSRDES